MWGLYLKSDEGIAIVSTPRKLKDGVHDKSLQMFVGNVEYVDFNQYPTWNNMFQPVIRKQMSFEHEREVRIVAVKGGEDGAMSGMAFEKSGVSVSIDINQVVDSVYIAPTAPAWLSKLVKQVAARYGLRCEIRQSSLSERPLW